MSFLARRSALSLSRTAARKPLAAAVRNYASESSSAGAVSFKLSEDQEAYQGQWSHHATERAFFRLARENRKQLRRVLHLN